MASVAGYRLGRLLGQGTYGETYEATKNGLRVALKLIREEAVQRGFDLERFRREVRALQKATGPNVVRFLDAGQGQQGNETRYFVAMEYLDGRDLAKAFQEAGGAFAEPALKSILAQVVSGLDTIHRQRIVHRDLKPANIFLTEAGEVKVLDFGLVKMLDYTTLTSMPGQPIGTPLYIAPEILRGQRVDFRADFYSLGVLIYYLVTTGKFPFDGRTPLELYAQVVNNPPTPPTRHNRALSAAYENLILTLLAKQPYERPSSHDELARAIQSTPLVLAHGRLAVARSRAGRRKKRCLFRLLHTEKSEVQRFIEAGGTMDGFTFQASYLPKYRGSLAALRDMGLRYLFDPMCYRLTYSSFAQTQGVVALPYVPDRENVLSEPDLQTLDAQQKYARTCIDWQRQWQCCTLVAPFHFCRDLGSPWIDIDIKLIEEALAYARSQQGASPVYAGLCLNIEAYTIEANRLALLNRYSRVRPEGYLFYVDNLDERTNNPLQLRAYLDLLRLFQRLGKPVYACRVGTLGLGMLAAGADGIEVGIASLSSFSEANLLVNRRTGYDMSKKYYIPGLMLTLPVPLAEDILSGSKGADMRCECPHCRQARSNLGRAAKPHFLHCRTAEVAELNARSTSPQRLEWFRARVDAALQRCDAVRRTKTGDLQGGHYAHLRAWLEVFTNPGGGTE